jgi:hypothetical protein
LPGSQTRELPASYREKLGRVPRIRPGRVLSARFAGCDPRTAAPARWWRRSPSSCWRRSPSRSRPGRSPLRWPARQSLSQRPSWSPSRHRGDAPFQALVAAPFAEVRRVFWVWPEARHRQRHWRHRVSCRQDALARGLKGSPSSRTIPAGGNRHALLQLGSADAKDVSVSLTPDGVVGL